MNQTLVTRGISYGGKQSGAKVTWYGHSLVKHRESADFWATQYV